MKTHTILLTTLLFLTFKANALTSFSKTIKYVQEKYANQFTEYPILIVDRDEVEYRYLKNNAFGEGDEKESLRVAVIQEYISEKVGVELTDAEAATYEMYATAMKSSALAMPIMGRDYKNRTDYVMCAVFPSSANTNQRLETHRILQLDAPNAYDGIANYEGLKDQFTLEELRLFSLYHELGHCMDRKFMPDLYKQYEPTPHHMHLGESYAEVFGLLMMELEGHKGLALKRALYRNLYTSIMGKWFVANPGYGYGNPLYISGGAIYYLVPSLLEARKRLMAKNPLTVKNLEEVKAAAKSIVETAGYKGRSFSAIDYWFKMGEDRALDLYHEYNLNMPDLFDGVYSDLTDFIFEREYLFGLLAGYAEPAPIQPSNLHGFDLAEACNLVSDKSQLFSAIQVARTELINWQGSYQMQLDKQEELNSVFENLSHCENEVYF